MMKRLEMRLRNTGGADKRERGSHMNDTELVKKVNFSMSRQIHDCGYATAVDVLMDVGILTKQNYEDWRFGKIPFLEKVCTANPGKLSTVRHQMRVYARKAGLTASWWCYKRWGVRKKGGQGRKPVIPLRFSKSGNEDIERQYATHFLDRRRIAQLREQKHHGDESPAGNIKKNRPQCHAEAGTVSS